VLASCAGELGHAVCGAGLATDHFKVGYAGGFEFGF
jgi:hypothetical protein